jgi:polysaccharide pyruvyl transferase WcaK-like protein
MLNVLIAHAYSTMNRGDGLLVELSKELIKEALGPDVRIAILALDAQSFRGSDPVLQYAPASRGFLSKASGISKIAFSTWLGAPSVPALPHTKFQRPDLVIGVGGGYLRSDGGLRSVKSLIAHGLQMRWLISLGVPMFYLPQSVGPLTDIEGKIIKRWASKIDRLNVRDDRSVSIFPHNSHIRRRPDLAVSSIARKLSVSSINTPPTENPGLIARHLQRSTEVEERYRSSLRALMKDIPGLTPILQSSGRGNDDPYFYSKMGWDLDAPYLRDLVSKDRRPQLVISVRLHGALESIIAGIPAIHLSYERKGFGAYDDLGISEFVHNANSFDVGLVIDQVEAIQANPRTYWEKLERSLPLINNKYEEMVLDLRQIARSRSL